MEKIRPLLMVTLTLTLALTGAGLAFGAGENCAGCHADYVTAFQGSKHAAITDADCTLCHAGSVNHKNAADPATLLPAVRFDSEPQCSSCHVDQYQSFEEDIPGKTYYGGSPSVDTGFGGSEPHFWSKTNDLPFWNALIDGHPFIIETFEERGMKYNQIDARDTRRPMGESCLTCHGTKVAYYMGLNADHDGDGNIDYPARVRTIENDQFVTSGYFDVFLSNLHGTLFVEGPHPKTGATVWGLDIPAGTQVSTFVDPAGDPAYGGIPHQVISRVELPDGRIYTTYDDPAATAFGSDPASALKRHEARSYIWAALEALSRDGQSYPDNQPSIDGLVCMQCHDSHTGKLRIIQKALIQGVATQGVNPYDSVKKNIKTFDGASRQDQIVMVCAQCHSEYIGGYSGIDLIDRHYFPWAKPKEAEQFYQTVAGYQQDTYHGKELGDPAIIIAMDEGIPTPQTTRPWQHENPNARGYYPEDGLFPLFVDDPANPVPINKTQHPEAEVFWNSKMYNAGATCTDCHTVRRTKPDGTRYTSHWFASPIKYIEHENNNPCARCHQMTGIQAIAQIKGLQDQYYALQERAQVALVNSLKYIQTLPAGAARDAAVANHQQAHFRWEYYAQGENSMSFHNRAEAVRETAAARTLAAQHVPWPLPPTQLEVASAAANSLTISFFDQATNETSYDIQRKLKGATWAAGGATIATIPGSSPASSNKTLTYQDNGLTANTDYVYRIAGLNGSGQSSWSIELAAKTAASNPPAVPTAPSNLTVTGVTAVSIFLQWTDNSDNEQGFTVERALDNTFTSGLATFNTGPNATTFADSGLTKLTTYYYRVRAFNPTGPSGWSNVVSAKTKKK
jgi:formate-dependent nitrite reductase cytochrome c552 subunit